MSGWILIDEKKPPIGAKVLVSVKKTDKEKGIVYKVSMDTMKEDGNFRNFPAGYVLAWMPMPKPYKGADHDSKRVFE
jgi:hypothetical protein